MDTFNPKEVWKRVFPFRRGDRVKYKSHYRKSWTYGDVISLNPALRFGEGGYLVYVRVYLSNGNFTTVWCGSDSLIKVKRRRRKK